MNADLIEMMTRIDGTYSICKHAVRAGCAAARPHCCTENLNLVEKLHGRYANVLKRVSAMNAFIVPSIALVDGSSSPNASIMSAPLDDWS